MNFDSNEVIKLKFGKSRKFKIRKSVYDSKNENRVQILSTIKVDNPENIERCVKIKMEDKAIMKNKEFYECSFNQIMKKIAECVKFYKGKTINVKPEIDKLNREPNVKFDKNKKVLIQFLSDEEFDKIFENIDTSEQNKKSNNFGGNINNQEGGYIDYYLKYLTLKYDLLLSPLNFTHGNYLFLE
jgi:hypothetical protein